MLKTLQKKSQKGQRVLKWKAKESQKSMQRENATQNVTGSTASNTKGTEGRRERTKLSQ